MTKIKVHCHKFLYLLYLPLKVIRSQVKQNIFYCILILYVVCNLVYDQDLEILNIYIITFKEEKSFYFLLYMHSFKNTMHCLCRIIILWNILIFLEYFFIKGYSILLYGMLKFTDKFMLYTIVSISFSCPKWTKYTSVFNVKV